MLSLEARALVWRPGQGKRSPYWTERDDGGGGCEEGRAGAAAGGGGQERRVKPVPLPDGRTQQ